MALDRETGTEPAAGFPALRLEDAPAPVQPPAPPKPRTKSRAGSKAAAPPPIDPALRGKPEDQEETELLPPESIKGWAVSAALHAVLLLILAFWAFTPRAKDEKVIDTTLAGSLAGSDLGDQLKGGLGLDTPTEMPEAPAVAPDPFGPSFTSLPASSLNIEIPKAATSNAAANGATGGPRLGAPSQAGNGDGFGVAKFGSGGENINGVDVKVGDPQFTLIWDSRADVDLHVLEPGGSHIYWENRNGEKGAELDVDDVDGFGPENIYWVQGKGPPGEYKWYVLYYGGLGGVSVPTRWKVRIKHNGQVTTKEGKFTTIGQKSQVYSFKLDPEVEKPKGDAAK